MKNKGTIILLTLTLVFFFLTVGVLVGRNLNDSQVTISFDNGNESASSSLPDSVIDGKININTAPVETLCDIPGIGETIAKRIIAYREKYGNFQHISDLMHVKGIGEKTFQSIADLITVGG